MIATFQSLLERLREVLAGKRALFVLSLLGLLTGILVGVVISLFRFSMELPQTALLPGGNPENYEALSWEVRLCLASGGGLLMGLLFHFASPQPLRVGVLHVLERLSYNEAHLPFKNMLMQFIGGVLAVFSGQSVGREGPSVHIGAANASLLGQLLRLPNTSIRTLVGCGAAAAIAASFNTPLAGVIFAMEVILMEYTIAGFTPIILSAVSATVVCRLVFGNEPILTLQQVSLSSFWELPAIVLMGIVIGGLAALFIRITRLITFYGQRLTIVLRMTLAGILVGLIAIICPEVMGVGADSFDLIALGELGLTALLLILLAKILATSISVGLSIPGGLIGPTVFIGAIAGGIAGQLLSAQFDNFSEIGLYTLLGMGAMMSATLQAPLAALLALLELSGNQNIIFPAMLAVVSANLCAQELFKCQSIFMSQFKEIGLDYRNDPISQHLRRIAVDTVINNAYVVSEPVIKRAAAIAYLTSKPDWLLIRRSDDVNLLMPAADLARYLENTMQQDEQEEIELLEIPAKRRQLGTVNLGSTLQYAQQLINETDAEALYVIRRIGQSADRIYGIITPEEIEKHYRF